MNFYKITGMYYDKPATYAGTLKEAHATAKEAKEANEHFRDEVRIELVDIETDKATLTSILSGWGSSEKLLRTWALTTRGGLREVPNGE